MSESVFIQYAPIIIVVFVFLVQQRLVVTPDQLEKKHREILDDVDKKYTTKEAHGLFQNQMDDMQAKIDKIYDVIIGKQKNG